MNLLAGSSAFHVGPRDRHRVAVGLDSSDLCLGPGLQPKPNGEADIHAKVDDVVGLIADCGKRGAVFPRSKHLGENGNVGFAQSQENWLLEVMDADFDQFSSTDAQALGDAGPRTGRP